MQTAQTSFDFCYIAAGGTARRPAVISVATTTVDTNGMVEASTVTYSYSMVPGIYGSKQTKSKSIAEDEVCLLQP